MIFGAGGLGLICIEILKAIGGKGAVVLDIDPVKREAAREERRAWPPSIRARPTR